MMVRSTLLSNLKMKEYQSETFFLSLTTKLTILIVKIDVNRYFLSLPSKSDDVFSLILNQRLKNKKIKVFDQNEF